MLGLTVGQQIFLLFSCIKLFSSNHFAQVLPPVDLSHEQWSATELSSLERRVFGSRSGIEFPAKSLSYLSSDGDIRDKAIA